MIDNELELLKSRHDELLQKLTKKQNEEDTKKRLELQKASLRASIKMIEEKLRGEAPAQASDDTPRPQVSNTPRPQVSKPPRPQVSDDTTPTQAKQTENETDAITGNGMYFSFKINKSSPVADMEKRIRNEIFKKIERGEI